MSEAIERGCGRRKMGGVYATVDTSLNGLPIEHFLLCLPQIVDLDAMGISPVGVSLIEVNGVHHVFDFVGRKHYPNVADFVEEARWFGISRRCEGIDYSKITSDSRLVLIHARAWVANAEEYVCGLPEKDLAEEVWPCPKGIKHHPMAEDEKSVVPCSGLWWHDVEGAENGLRKMPSFEYRASARPAGVDGQYQSAIYGVWPLSRFEVVSAPDGAHDKKLSRVSRAQVPVSVVEE